MRLQNLGKKVRKVFLFPFDKLLYKEFGFKSLIFKPILLYGRKYISLGRSVNFYKGARIECIDQHLGQHFQPSLTIGNNTTFEQDAHITCAGKITIGKDCTFLARVLITNISHSYSIPKVKALDQEFIVRDVKIGNCCFVGMDAKIFPGVTIGDNVIIGANSLVLNDVPSYSVVVGCPARVIKKYDFDRKEWVTI